MESFTKTLPRVEREVAEAADAIQAEAIRIFRVVHGPGDAGSEHAFNCLNEIDQLGWGILAAEFLKLKKKKKAKANEPNSASS